jgi:hypothetical protein
MVNSEKAGKLKKKIKHQIVENNSFYHLLYSDFFFLPFTAESELAGMQNLNGNG